MRKLLPGDVVRWRNEMHFLTRQYADATGIITAVFENEVESEIDGVLMKRPLRRYAVIWNDGKLTITAEHVLWQVEHLDD